MTVKELIEKLKTFDPEMTVLSEFDCDGDEFLIKVDISDVYKGDGVDDTGGGDFENDYCIIKIN